MQSSLSSLIAIMNTVIYYLYEIGGPVLMVIGTVGCTINLIVFSQKSLRKNPCSIYFIAFNIANFFYIYSSLLALILSAGYNVNPSVYNLIICRLRLYASLLFDCLSAFYLILASIDRVFITTRNVRCAYKVVIIGTIFWFVFHSHALIFSDIIQIHYNYFLCYYQLGDYLSFIGYYSIIKEIITLLLLTICAVWSMTNIQNTCCGVVFANPKSNSPKDRQFSFMLFINVIIHGLFSLVFVIFLIYQQITQNQVKSIEQQQIEVIIRNLCLFNTNIPVCISCYINLLVSKKFRSEAKKIRLCK
ncbi:unnamed protein product [Adineta steineri]|uniref:G-protein coupled receptors family 1 profile domain-containing protein n=1 Tax=Adineta steineri TaxID=433720 RepID=A0A815JMM4_9BILA|nr:unnamed protein product [Adineta steineri]CAF3807820.1 unnamed protein product [Adineta steineri]